MKKFSIFLKMAAILLASTCLGIAVFGAEAKPSEVAINVPLWHLGGSSEADLLIEVSRGKKAFFEGYGEGIEFDGIGSRAIIQGTPSYNGKDSATVCLFFRCATLPRSKEEGGKGAGALLSCDYRLLARVHSGGEVYGGFVNEEGRLIGVFSDQKIANDEWHHLAFSFSAVDQQMKLYLDGALVGIVKSDIGKLAPLPESPLVLGSDPDGNDHHGAVADVRIYDSALSQEEIAKIITEAQSGS